MGFGRLGSIIVVADPGFSTACSFQYIDSEDPSLMQYVLVFGGGVGIVMCPGDGFI